MEIPEYISPDLEVEIYEPSLRRVFIYTKKTIEHRVGETTLKCRLCINCESPCEHEQAKMKIYIVPEYECLSDYAKEVVKERFDEHAKESDYGVYEVVESGYRLLLDVQWEAGNFDKALEVAVKMLVKHAGMSPYLICRPLWNGLKGSLIPTQDVK